MRTLESTGKSVDEAIFNGIKTLGISIDEVEIEILQQETKGVFGIGAKPAVVKLTEREPEEIVLPDYIVNKDKPRERRDGGQRNDRGRGRSPQRSGRDERFDRGDRPQRAERSERPVHEERLERTDRAERPERTDRPERSPRPERTERPAKPNIDYSAEAAENNEAARFLSGLLERMGVQANVLANIAEDGNVRLYIDSANMGMLIGHRGETLDAIQYICSLALNRNRKEQGYTRLTIDTEGYRDKREETLTRLARKIASQVKASGRARTLEPMNPYERRVLHATLQNHPYVSTHSEGEEPNRRVVIEPKRN